MYKFKRFFNENFMTTKKVAKLLSTASINTGFLYAAYKFGQYDEKNLKRKNTQQLKSEASDRIWEITNREAYENSLKDKIDTGMHYMYIGSSNRSHSVNFFQNFINHFTLNILDEHHSAFFFENQDKHQYAGYYVSRYPRGYKGVAEWLIAIDKNGIPYIGITIGEGDNYFDRVGGHIFESGGKAGQSHDEESIQEWEMRAYQYTKARVKNPLQKAAQEIKLSNTIKQQPRMRDLNMTSAIYRIMENKIPPSSREQIEMSLSDSSRLIGPFLSEEPDPDTPYSIGNFIYVITVNVEDIGKLKMRNDRKRGYLCFVSAKDFYRGPKGNYCYGDNEDKRCCSAKKFQGLFEAGRGWLTCELGSTSRLSTEISFDLEVLQSEQVANIIAERIQYYSLQDYPTQTAC